MTGADDYQSKEEFMQANKGGRRMLLLLGTVWAIVIVLIVYWIVRSS